MASVDQVVVADTAALKSLLRAHWVFTMTSVKDMGRGACILSLPAVVHLIRATEHLLIILPYSQHSLDNPN